MTEENNMIDQPFKIETGLDTPETASVFSSGITWIPLIKMMQYTSKPVKDQIYKAGEYIFNNDLNLSDSFNAVIVDMQPEAIEFKNSDVVRKSNTMETQQVEVVDEETGEKKLKSVIVGDKDFLEISQGVDNRQEGISFRWGMTVLLFLPDHGVWGQIFLATKSARNVIEDFLALKSMPATIYSKRVETQGMEYVVPKVKGIPQAEIPQGWIPPSKESIMSALEKFKPKPQPTDAGSADEMPDR